MSKYKHALWVIVALALTQLMCVLGPASNSPEQMTSVAGDVQKTVESLQKTANPNQIVFPTPDKAFQETSIAIQTFEPGPEPVKATAAVQAVLPTQPAQTNKPGSIGGNLSYPAEVIPPLTVAAYQVENGSMTGEKYLVDTPKNQATYQIENLPAGKYYVVAYLREGTLPGINGLAGGYSKYVLCGATPACTDHALVEVQVFADTMTGEINPQDWYAPDNSFPPEPAK